MHRLPFGPTTAMSRPAFAINLGVGGSFVPIPAARQVQRGPLMPENVGEYVAGITEASRESGFAYPSTAFDVSLPNPLTGVMEHHPNTNMWVNDFTVNWVDGASATHLTWTNNGLRVEQMMVVNREQDWDDPAKSVLHSKNTYISEYLFNVMGPDSVDTRPLSDEAYSLFLVDRTFAKIIEAFSPNIGGIPLEVEDLLTMFIDQGLIQTSEGSEGIPTYKFANEWEDGLDFRRICPSITVATGANAVLFGLTDFGSRGPVPRFFLSHGYQFNQGAPLEESRIPQLITDRIHKANSGYPKYQLFFEDHKPGHTESIPS